MTAVILSLLVLVAVFLDQISKYLVVINMELSESVEIVPGILRFTYIQNRGAAFGSMANNRWIFMVLSVVAIIAIIVYLFWKKPQSKLVLSAAVLLVGGGIGNMIDRVRLGYVIDFIDFCAFPNLWKWIFNLADAFVCIGTGLLLLWFILDTFRESKQEKLLKLSAQSDGAELKAEAENNGSDNESSGSDSENNSSDNGDQAINSANGDEK